MSEHVIKMPRLGESVTEGTVTAWFKQVGDTVEFDEPLFEVSTDKVDSEIPSPFHGVLLEILVPAGDTVEVDRALARLGQPGASPEPAPALATGSATAAGGSARVAGRTGTATGAGGSAAISPGGATSSPRPPGAAGNGGRRLLSPIVRRLAAEHAIDLAEVTGSGEGGRIMREDVQAAIAARATAPAPPDAPAPAAAGDRTEVVPMSRLRVVIADNMVRSLQISPHIWTSVEVDLERIEELRRQHKERFRKQEGVGLTYLPFVARALCGALRRFPALNSSVDMSTRSITFHHYVNLGVAVDLDEQGLIVPVIKDADSLNLRGLARAINAKATAARNRSLSADDVTGSTFTITNPGPMGDYASAPIINQPNVAIMSTNQVARRPTAVGELVAIHHMTILGLSYDHRALDGVTASRFLASVRDSLQDRDWEAELQ
jgi:2-oxoglutarate dehydrogenase E2 component (dihydrolipoamide succinyltransferase)